MKKIMEYIQKKRWIDYIIILIIGIALSISLSDMMIRNTHDGTIHLNRIVGDYKMLKQGQFPVMIIDNYCNGDGYNMNVFYPPLVTYIPLLIRLFTSTTVMALKLFGALCIILSGFTMYKLVYNITKKRGIALVASIIYLVAPYKLANVYVRYAIGEFVAYVFLPLLFLGLHNLINENGRKHYYIAIGAIGLILCHNITAMYAAIFSVIYLILHIRKLQDNEVLKKLGINAIFIVLCTALYILPMLEAKSYTLYGIFDNFVMGTNNTYVPEQALDVMQFFKDTSNKVKSVSFKIGIPTLILFVSSLYCASKVDKKIKKTYWIYIVFSLISLWMCTNLFPWKYAPNILCKLQFPWRMLGFFIFFSALICAINLCILVQKFAKKQWLKKLIYSITIILFLLNTIPSYQEFYKNANRREEEFPTDSELEQFLNKGEPLGYLKTNIEYMPSIISFRAKFYGEERRGGISVLEGNATIKEESKNSLTVDASLENISKNTILEFSFVFYPGYEITLINENGKYILESKVSKNGYLSTVLPQDIEKARIHVEYKGSIITKTSYLVSILSGIILIMYIYKSKKAVKGENNEAIVKK